jgi:hypothetical protein
MMVEAIAAINILLNMMNPPSGLVISTPKVQRQGPVPAPLLKGCVQLFAARRAGGAARRPRNLGK